MILQPRYAFVLLGLGLIAGAAQAEEVLKVSSKAFENGEKIPDKFAYCVPDGSGHTKKGDNVSPEITWGPGPSGTKSYALIVTDPDVPADFTDANKDGKTIPNESDRQDFFHWSLMNIPITVTQLPEGVGKGRISPFTGKADFMGWPGINDYAEFMKDKPKGLFYGYDGPCPPFNDARIHHYHFTVYALSVEKSMYLSTFNGKNALEALDGKILAKGELIGTFTNRKTD